MSTVNAADAVFDVRRIEPRLRHALIFSTFDKLAPAEAFLLVSDHNPKPLLDRFGADRPGEFRWHYLERGPDVWRVRISRAAA